MTKFQARCEREDEEDRLRMTENETRWQLLGVWGVFEYWLTGGDVFRRKVSAHNITSLGAPMGVRWESSLAHFQRYVAGVLPVGHNNRATEGAARGCVQLTRGNYDE